MDPISDLDEAVTKFGATQDDVFLLSANDSTEDLVSFLTSELSDAELDEIDVYRELKRRGDLASEPLTAAVLIGVSGKLILTVGRIIERWLENRRQKEQIELTMIAFKESRRAGEAVSDIVRSNAGVSVEYKLAPPTTPER
jgi:hypothetical protein